MAANGRLPGSQLTTVEPGVQLAADGTDDAYRAFRMYAYDRARTLRVAAPAGGYRSYAVQAAMHQAGSPSGTAAQRRKWGLNPDSVVAIAAAGYSTHGTGTRADLVGTDLDWIVANAARFGFTREFGARDPNHFQHHPDRWAHSVPATRVTVTGRVGGTGTAFRKRVQILARLGGYDGPVDGDEGDRTWAAVNAELGHRKFGVGVTGLQRWAGVPDRDVDVTTGGWGKVRPGNVRRIAAALNRL